MERKMMRVTLREYDTILAALRCYQDCGGFIEGIDGGNDIDYRKLIAADHGRPLTMGQIDTLIERVQAE